MKKALSIVFMVLTAAALFCGCGKKAAFAPPEGQGWLEAWLREEEGLAESLTFRELAGEYDWIAKAEIAEISPLREREVRLPNGETWTEAYREYALKLRASFPEEEGGMLRLRAASVYTDAAGLRLTTPWRQTEWEGLTLQTGQSLWLFGREQALGTAPFSGSPAEGLILVFDELDRLLPCRGLSRIKE